MAAAAAREVAAGARRWAGLAVSFVEGGTAFFGGATDGGGLCFGAPLGFQAGASEATGGLGPAGFAPEGSVGPAVTWLLSEAGRALVGGIVFGAVLVALAAALWLRHRRRRVVRHRGRAAAAEVAAEALLTAAGFQICGRQVRRERLMWVDGERTPVHVCADLIVRRRGRRFVAEVKSGEMAPKPTHRATRRQLLDYAWMFRGHGVLLVDPERARIVEVDFPGLASRGDGAPWLWGAVGLAAGILGFALVCGAFGGGG